MDYLTHKSVQIGWFTELTRNVKGTKTRCVSRWISLGKGSEPKTVITRGDIGVEKVPQKTTTTVL